METNFQNEKPETKVTAVEEAQDLNYWSDKFGIAKEELIEVVKRGGTFATAVENFVKKTEFAV